MDSRAPLLVGVNQPEFQTGNSPSLDAEVKDNVSVEKETNQILLNALLHL